MSGHLCGGRVQEGKHVPGNVSDIVTFVMQISFCYSADIKQAFPLIKRRTLNGFYKQNGENMRMLTQSLITAHKGSTVSLVVR